ncbi:MAG: TraB/GumN family protein [Muribaculaceae bacterium]|nr:TraB/GumN family protein [Muribaculaceae bacterium]
MKFIILPLISLLVSLSAYSQIFYKIEGNGLKEPSYLFGTHHLAPTSILDSYPSLPQALEETKAVVGEIDMTASQMEMAMAMQPYMMAPADSTLTALLTVEELADLNKKFEPYAPMPGITLEHLGTMRPMVISAMVSLGEMQKSLPGFDPNAQLDASFQLQAKSEGKEIIPLETADMQARLLYTFTPIKKQLADLKELLEKPEELVENCGKLNKAYLEGDLNTLLALTEGEDSDPAFMEALLTLRNRNWMKSIPDIINSRPSLIAVGALHLAGDEGLVNQLRKAGYTVTAIK